MSEDVAFLRAACESGVLVAWEVVVVLWPLLELVERWRREREELRR